MEADLSGRRDLHWWFVGARVATAVTILRRQVDPARRMRNTVRSVQLLYDHGVVFIKGKRPLADINTKIPASSS